MGPCLAHAVGNTGTQLDRSPLPKRVVAVRKRVCGCAPQRPWRVNFRRLGIATAVVATASCRTPEPVQWVQRFPLLTSHEHPLVDSLWVLARDSFPEIPVERINVILGREPGAPITVRFGHVSGYMERPDGTDTFGHASYPMWVGGEVCVWHDEILPREQALFVSCFRHTVGTQLGYEIDVVVDGYRPQHDFEYVKLREVQVRVSERKPVNRQLSGAPAFRSTPYTISIRWRTAAHGSPAIHVRLSRPSGTVQQGPVQRQETQIVQP